SARIELQSDEISATPLTELILFQVAREALRNAVKYADATLIRLRVQREGFKIRLVVEDDGKGFCPATVDASNHFGLQMMRERVEMAGGRFELSSTPGKGTCVEVVLSADASFQ